MRGRLPRIGPVAREAGLTANGAEALTSITVEFVDSPCMAVERETAKLRAGGGSHPYSNNPALTHFACVCMTGRKLVGH